MMTLADEPTWFSYPPCEPFPCGGACWLRLYQAPGRRPVLVFTDLKDERNPGPSVDYAIGQLAAKAWRELLPDLTDPPVFVTHFQRGRCGRSDLPEDFSRARFAWVDPHGMRLGGVQWSGLTVKGLACLVGRTHAELLVAWQEPDVEQPVVPEGETTN